MCTQNALPLMLLLGAAALVGDAPPTLAADRGPWKVLRTLRLPSPPVGASISDDRRQVLLLCPERRQVFTGGIGPKVFQVHFLRAFDVETGKQVFVKDFGELPPLMSQKSQRLAVGDQFDKVTVYDTQSWRVLAQIDTRSPKDNPPGALKGVPDFMKDFGGGGRLGDIELSADGKTLVTVRMATTGWKANPKGTAFTAESFQQVTFWDADKGTKLASLDCEDKEATNGGLSLLPRRHQMLVKFDNGVRLLDLASRKWGLILPVKDVYVAAFSPDEKVLAITDHDQRVKLFSLESGKELLSFKERALNMTPRLNGGLGPAQLQFGPAVQFVDEGKCLRVTLNDGKTVVFHDAATGAKVKAAASGTLTFPGGPVKVLAVSSDHHLAVTTTPQPSVSCTLWQRGPVAPAKNTAPEKKDR